MKEFKTLEDILDFAIASEQEAVEFYTSLAKQSSNSAMKEVFEQFAREETGHKARLIAIKATGDIILQNIPVMDLKIGDYLVEVEAKPDISYQEALIVAMKKEKSAFKLYSELSERANSAEYKNLFKSLAVEEAKHKLRFEIEYDDYMMKEN
jgi:rubrerythrin